MVHLFKEPLIEKVLSYDVILVPMGIHNAFSTGFCYEVGLNFPSVKEKEKEGSPYGDRRKYGTLFPAKVGKTTFCLCYIHNTGFKKDKDGRFLNLDALKTCLFSVRDRFGGRKIASPVLGAEQCDGNWDRGEIISLFESIFKEVDIDLYDYEQRDYQLECFKEIATLHDLSKRHEIKGEEYDRRRSEIEWRRRNGIFKPMPEGYRYQPRKYDYEKVIKVTKKDLEG